ncbi:cellulase family glycosylhydrolase [Lutibacter sp. B1]|uniref:cellulase family glycosylhydrolase n=1 Tax=Lutibacter sp. B1 TaxID=2725996 RepID=UPI0014571F41|nr:cellulase family glycosylhydrolase [Lutibacter sp. B1]NLP56897.1 cellulase family glycosylhydrolase [Lutibacter sp. B1]
MKKIIKHPMSLLMVILTLIMNFTSCSDDDDDQKIKKELTVTPTTLQFTAEGGYKVINISADSNTSWEINNLVDWCIPTTTSSKGSKTFNVFVEANELQETRSTTLTVSSINKSVIIEISQEAAPAPEPDEEEPDEEEPYIEDDPSNMSAMTSLEIVENMGIGFNIGNSLDAIGGETAWGNPVISQELIDAIKNAGFNAVRIPIAWSRFSDANNYTIDANWMERVETVVNYVLDNDMYAIINIHWDGGWMQPTYDQQDYVNDRLDKMWQQIAINFRDYDYHLLFAGTNEVMVEGDYGTPTEEYYTVQNSFNQTFVNTVRATGGRNAYRFLVFQTFNTNIDYGVNFAIIPEDTVENRLMAEAHYYDPYNFTLNEGSDTIWQWGSNATDSNAVETWANEDYADAQFEKMKTTFVDQNIGVILGEYGVIARTNIDGHEAFRENYLKYITQSAINHKMAPFYWDNGVTDNHGMGLFNRSTAEQAYPNLINAIINK